MSRCSRKFLIYPLITWKGRSGTVVQHRSHPTISNVRNLCHHSTSPTARVIDMRSDVRTKPTPEMLKAMTSTTWDDDVFDEDNTVKELQNKMAAMFGKEAALFLVSGTMANLVAAGGHCPQRGREVIMGDKSHTFLWEQGNMSQFLGLHARTLRNLPDGTIDLNDIEHSIRPTNDPHQPFTGLVTMENTHNYCGGRVIRPDYFKILRVITNRNGGIPIHLDGSRLFNAIIALNIEPSVLVKDVDSVSMCFSKGIGTPIGSILVGNHRLIEEGKRLRKGLGGGWRQPGPLAAAALHGLSDVRERMTGDHARAKRFAKTLVETVPKLVGIDLEGIQTNLIPEEIKVPGVSPTDFCRRLEEAGDEKALHGERVVVRVAELNRTSVRFVTHSSISDDDIELASKKVCRVLQELSHHSSQ